MWVSTMLMVFINVLNSMLKLVLWASVVNPIYLKKQ